MGAAQQLDQSAGTRDYLPRHARVEPDQASAPVGTAPLEPVLYSGPPATRAAPAAPAVPVAPTPGPGDRFPADRASNDVTTVTPGSTRHRWTRRWA